jgi:hypothetical protein
VPNVQSKHVVCVSWIENLAKTRELLLKDAGCEVTSILGREYFDKLHDLGQADLLVLAHSVPQQQKQHILQLFREKSRAPVLSLPQPHQTKLPDADFGVEATSPADFVRVVREILAI